MVTQVLLVSPEPQELRALVFKALPVCPVFREYRDLRVWLVMMAYPASPV